MALPFKEINRPGGIGPDKGFNISDFKAYRETLGVTHTHSYSVEIMTPPIMQQNNETFRLLEMMCDAVSFPGVTLDTYQVQYYGFGNIVRRPTVPDLTPIQCSFVDDRKNTVYKTMHDWQRSIVNYFGDPYKDQGAYEINYLSEYSTDIRIRTYDPAGSLVRIAAYREAYPIIVSDVQYSWGRLNEIVKVPVVFAYTDWKEE